MRSGACYFSSDEYFLQGDGYYIRDNQIQFAVTNLKIKGNIKKHLEEIDHVGNDFTAFACECGKMGDSIRVGIGAPTISICEAFAEGTVYLYGQ